MSVEHRKLEDRLRLSQDHVHLATQRAITAEVDILQLRVENVKRPGEARLMEIDRIWYTYTLTWRGYTLCCIYISGLV